jgi:large-conductance mechanosensitive channel
VKTLAKNLKYVKFSDEEVAEETKNRLREMKKLLLEIRDLLKSAGE